MPPWPPCPSLSKPVIATPPTKLLEGQTARPICHKKLFWFSTANQCKSTLHHLTALDLCCCLHVCISALPPVLTFISFCNTSIASIEVPPFPLYLRTPKHTLIPAISSSIAQYGHRQENEVRAGVGRSY